MASWRDTASEEAQADLDELFNVVLPFAEQELSKCGEMYPFAAGISTEGQVEVRGADPGLGERPASQAVLDALYVGARESSGTRRAVAFVADVRVNGADAIRVEAEHRDGLAIQILIPYTRSRFKKSVTLGLMSAAPGDAHVWPRE